MDRLAQTALSAIRQMKDNKFDLAHNLSNVNVPGFRRDLPNEGNAAFLKELDKVSAKVLPLEVDRRSFSNEAGPLQNTGLATDVAVLNEGFFFIAPENGEIALSRRGDFGIDALNQLVNGAGDVVLSDGLAPIILPEFVDISITDIGEILVQQAGAPDGEFTSVGFIGSTSTELDQLVKSLDPRVAPPPPGASQRPAHRRTEYSDRSIRPDCRPGRDSFDIGKRRSAPSAPTGRQSRGRPPFSSRCGCRATRCRWRARSGHGGIALWRRW